LAPKSKYGTPRELHGLIEMKLKADNPSQKSLFLSPRTDNRILKIEKRSGNCKSIEAEIQFTCEIKKTKQNKTKQNNLKN